MLVGSGVLACSLTLWFMPAFQGEAGVTMADQVQALLEFHGNWLRKGHVLGSFFPLCGFNNGVALLSAQHWTKMLVFLVMTCVGVLSVDAIGCDLIIPQSSCLPSLRSQLAANTRFYIHAWEWASLWNCMFSKHGVVRWKCQLFTSRAK